MTETMVLINPRPGDNGRTRFDARVPLMELVPGLTLHLRVNCNGDGKMSLKKRCVVRHVHYKHRWIRVEYKAGGKTLLECMKFVEEGE